MENPQKLSTSYRDYVSYYYYVWVSMDYQHARMWRKGDPKHALYVLPKPLASVLPSFLPHASPANATPFLLRKFVLNYKAGVELPPESTVLAACLRELQEA